MKVENGNGWRTQNTADINDNQNGKCRNGNCHDDLAAVKVLIAIYMWSTKHRPGAVGSSLRMK